MMDKDYNNIEHRAMAEVKKCYEAPEVEELSLDGWLNLLASLSIEASVEDFEDWEDL